MKDLSEKEIFLATILFSEFILLFNYSSKFWIVTFFMLATLFYGVSAILEVSGRKKIFQNIHYFILPILYFLAVFFFLSIVKARLLQIVIITVYSVSNVFLLRSIRRVKRFGDNPLVISRNIISLIGLITVFLIETDITNIMIFYKLPVYLGIIVLFSAIWAVSYFLYRQYRDADAESIVYITLISLIMAELLWAGSFWITGYPSFEIGSLGVPVISIISLVIYYSFWGIAHHKLENDLTKKVLLEYTMISIIIITIILFTADWLPKGFAG